jgi:hypothetical protein
MGGFIGDTIGGSIGDPMGGSIGDTMAMGGPISGIMSMTSRVTSKEAP